MALDLTKVPARYRLNIEALLTSLLPALLRQKRMVAWIQALHLPLLSLYEQFIEHVKRSTTELSYNGQTMMLEKALNDRFDPGFRRIKIINSDTELEPVYLNFVSEQQPAPALYLDNEGEPLLYINAWNEYTNQVGFTVQVPRSLAPKQASLQARIKQLKLALIRHTIVYK
ncbi:hypothetical protein [Hymenobacter cavernae]|uniref:Uncharacterized protein n=1 Tax=Hymenobacter cavernae TaxID=2044852 RepID=A0ABQ1UM90_9BACT|nr:hypothetical protein [Hymenobacter cavernae]GGF22167.1 hypothetical protein GCM10011383_37230 [Hymenobacter cavernae]